MSTKQHQQLYDLQKKARLIKGKKTPESSRALEVSVAVLEAKTYNSSNESLFPDEKPKANNRNNQALDRKGSITRQSHTITYWSGLLIGDGQPSVPRNSSVKPLTTV